MIQIRLLKDWKTKKAGDIINISEKGAKSFINAGAGEYLNNSEKTNTKKEKKAIKDLTEKAMKTEKLEKVEIENLGEFELRSPKKVKQLKPVYENGNYLEENSYRIWNFKFGIGQNPQILISTDRNENLQSEQELFIKVVQFGDVEEIKKSARPEKNVIKKLANFLHIHTEEGKGDNKVTREIGEIWVDILNKDVFKKVEPVSEESFEKIRSLTNDQVKELLNYYLTEGSEFDKRIIESVKAKLLKVSEDSLFSDYIMPYNPHGIDVTNTKVGKSYEYGKIGIKNERLSMSGALGFSTANETNKGDLDGVRGAYTIDELQEESNENTLKQTLTVMETGKARVSMGRAVVTTQTYGILTYLTNPKEITEEQISFDNPKLRYLEAFKQLLDKLSDNYKALGSRFGIINFGNDYKPVKGSRMDAYKFLKIERIYTSLIENLSNKVTNILLNENIKEWLDTELPGEYCAKIQETAKNIPIQQVREFWQNHTEAFRHIRGGAVRRAILDFVSDLLNDKEDIEKIIEKAEEWLAYFCEINLNSLNYMATISQDFKTNLPDKIIENTKPEYLKHFIIIALKHLENADDKRLSELILINELKTTFQSFENREEKFGGKYSRFNEIKYAFDNLKPRAKSVLLNDYGVKITEIEDETSFHIVNKEKFLEFLKTKYYKNRV